MQATLDAAANMLAQANAAVALTGAGISVESGIPPFRGPGGVWETVDPMEYATVDAFYRQPGIVWQVLIRGLTELLHTAAPNAAHQGLARLEAMGHLKAVITQNVDGLHQQAGSRNVIEFHGTFSRVYCLRCGDRRRVAELKLTRLPPQCACGGIYRPDCVFFGEMIPPEAMRRARQLAAACDVMLVIGTSAVVQPAAAMPALAKGAGARIIEVNPQPTPLTPAISDIFLQGPAAVVMRNLMGKLPK